MIFMYVEMKCLVMEPVGVLSKCIWCLILLMSYKFIGSLSDMGKIPSPQNQFGKTIQSEFTTKNNSRVIAQKGGLAILPCVVKLNSPATVSWIRRKDFQLLTVGLSTHSSDKRFLVEHTRHMGHWSLRIKSVREEDRGLYECQLSIYPTQSILIELKVVEAVAAIIGSPDLHIDEGSTLRLECKVDRATENPAFVFWYHDRKMVNYDSQNGFAVISVIDSLHTIVRNETYFSGKRRSKEYEISSTLSENNNSVNIANRSYTNNYKIFASHKYLPSSNIAQQQQSSFLLTPSKSILTIQEVHFNHAGNYTCAPSNARPASITVHVLRGERPAAMQHANRSVTGGENNNSSIISSGGDSTRSAAPSKAKEPFRIRLLISSKLVEFLIFNRYPQQRRSRILLHVVAEIINVFFEIGR